MSAFVLPHRMWQQPQNRPVLDLGNPLLRSVSEVLLPTAKRSLVQGTLLVAGNPTFPPAIRSSAAGMSWSLNTSASNIGMQCSTADAIFQSLSTTTMFVFRRSRDTTLRASMLCGSASATISQTVLAHAPYSDGNIYFDFGGSGASTRISTTFAKSTSPETLVFIAGPNKGREIWRNGVKIAGNVTLTGTRTSSATGFGVGGNGSSAIGQDNDDVYLLGVVVREWSDAEVRTFAANPWGIFTHKKPRWGAIVAAAAAAALHNTRLSVGTMGLRG